MSLPFVVLVVVPSVILFLETEFYGSGWPRTPDGLMIPVISIVLFLVGASLFIWTNWLFISQGAGTLAPWDPPVTFVVRGPYRHVRNPMIIAVWLVLLAEAAIFQSPGITFWSMFFIAANMIYFPLKEEKDLVKRFGEQYEEYRRHVPAWILRLTSWKGNHES